MPFIDRILNDSYSVTSVQSQSNTSAGAFQLQFGVLLIRLRTGEVYKQ